MRKPKPSTRPHVHTPDPDVPPDPLDRTGRTVCAHCHLLSRADDPRHTLPDLIDQSDEMRRRTGERGDA